MSNELDKCPQGGVDLEAFDPFDSHGESGEGDSDEVFGEGLDDILGDIDDAWWAEQDAFRNRYKPLVGITLNGQQLYTDTQTDDIVDCNGQPINSCDALDAFLNRYKPLVGITLNGQQLYTDTQTDDIVDCNGQPINSCDALAVIDGMKKI